MAAGLWIEDFVFDDENEEEMAGHGISPDHVLQVHDGPYTVKKIVVHDERRI
jgi:hypothetical protein